MDDVARQTLQKYNLEYQAMLGRGSFGNVYLINDKTNNQNKVVKVIHIKDREPKEVVDIVNECVILAQLNHKNIVQYYINLRDDTNFYILQEYCEGGDLAKHFKNCQTKSEYLSIERILTWMSQVASALSYVHSKCIIHRDIKPSNIFIKTNDLKIGDFGLAKELDLQAQMQSIKGTKLYLSPEQCCHALYTVKVDVWALGILLYEMCTYTTPFKSLDEIIYTQSPKLPVPYHDTFNTLLDGLLNKNEANRLSSTKALELINEKHCELVKQNVMKRDISSVNSDIEMTESVESTFEIKRRFKQTNSSDSSNCSTTNESAKEIKFTINKILNMYHNETYDENDTNSDTSGEKKSDECEVNQPQDLQTNTQFTCYFCKALINGTGFKRIKEKPDIVYHKNCSKCSNCSKSIEGATKFRNNKLYCIECCKTLFNPKCYICQNLITSSKIYKIKTNEQKQKEYCHKECMKCVSCSQPAPEKFKIHESTLYCRNCYEDKFYKKCFECKLPIFGYGKLLQINNESIEWHEKCFKCVKCHKKFEQDHIIYNSKKQLFCTNCKNLL